MTTLRDLSSLLAPALGWETAHETVSNVIVDLGLDATNLGAAHARLVLLRLSDAPGVVGAAARVARARSHDRSRDTLPEPAVLRALPQEPRHDSIPAAESRERTITRTNLAALLTRSLDRERAEIAIFEAAASLDIGEDPLSRDQALRVLEMLALRRGSVAVAARFAKATLAMRT